MGWRPGSKPGSNRAATGQQPGTIEEGKEGKKGRRSSANAELLIAKRARPLEERRSEFQAACKVITDQNPDRLPIAERKPFFAYWTEPDKKGRMRWEAEKFFDHGRRMDTWKRNAEARASSAQPKTRTHGKYQQYSSLEQLAREVEQGAFGPIPGIHDTDPVPGTAGAQEEPAAGDAVTAEPGLGL